MRPKAETEPMWVRVEPEHTGRLEEVGNGAVNEQQQWQATKEPPCLTLSGPCQVNCVNILF